MAASNFDEALRRLLVHEGGYSNHPSDPGGATKFGITIGDYRKYVKADATPADVQAMPVEAAKAIYRARYWNALRCDRLPAGLDYALFDYGVNSGVARAARVARALVGTGAGTTLDDASLAALRAADTGALIAHLCEERLAFLKRLKTWPVFGRGWERRVTEVRAAALAMARAAQSTTVQPSGKAPGKGVVPVAKTAQRGSAGAVAAGGTAAAGQAQSVGASSGMVLAIVVATVALALAAWLFWRWRQRRAQLAPALAAAPGNASQPQGLPQ